MKTQKVLFCGPNEAFFQALRVAAPQLDIQQTTAQKLFQSEALDPAPGMAVLFHAPPLVDGLAALRRLKARLPETPIVVATADYSGETTRLLFKAGAEDVLRTPADAERILACYEAYLPGFRLKAIPKSSRKTAASGLLAVVAPGILMGNIGAVEPPSFAQAQESQAMEQSVEACYPGLDVSFFGQFSVRWNGRRVELTKQAKMLFACLAYHYPKPLNREYLAKIFWPDKYEAATGSARRSLNVELTHIRKAFAAQCGVEPDFLRFEQNAYRLDLRQPLQSDVLAFKNLYKRVQALRRNGAEVPEEVLQQAILLYAGNFLDDCPADAYNWVEVERLHLSSVFEEIADLRSELLCRQGNYWEASAVCGDILSRDFRMEVIHRRAMQCYAKLGMLHKVEHQFALCCKMMEQEFQSKPSVETLRAYEAIRKSVA
jgi:DNA-binding SARP family transcriptional activator/ActR/RegA family two-component response regulator